MSRKLFTACLLLACCNISGAFMLQNSSNQTVYFPHDWRNFKLNGLTAPQGVTVPTTLTSGSTASINFTTTNGFFALTGIKPSKDDPNPGSSTYYFKAIGDDQIEIADNVNSNDVTYSVGPNDTIVIQSMIGGSPSEVFILQSASKGSKK